MRHGASGPLVLVLFLNALLTAQVRATEGGQGDGVVSGVVRDERGNPLQVELAIEADPLVFRWSSDERGRFRLTGVPREARNLVYKAKGIPLGGWSLPTGPEEMTVVVYKHPGITVRVLNARGHRMHGIRVVAKRVDSAEPAEEIDDPETGMAGVVGLPPGRYRFSAPEHPDVVEQTVEIVAFRPVWLTLRQREGATLRVRVVDREGLRLDEMARLVRGTMPYPSNDKELDQLALFSPSSVEKRRGAIFGGLEPGSYTVLVPVPECAENVSTAHPLSVSSGGGTTTIQLPFSYQECP